MSDKKKLFLFGLLGSFVVQETTAFVANPPRRGVQHVYDTALPVSASEDLIRLNEPSDDDRNNNKKKECPEEQLKLAFETETPETVGMLYAGILNYESGTESVSPPPLSSKPASSRKSPKTAAAAAAAAAVVTEKTPTTTTKNKRKMRRKESNDKKTRQLNKNDINNNNNKTMKDKKRVIKNKNHRRHDFEKRESFLKEQPDLDFYTLHSSAVSYLYKDMPIDDITRAIKRAQNLHDTHDLVTIATFLIHECDVSWHRGTNVRGSLLSRLAVAALHCNEVDVAMQAIEARRTYERPSMEPYQSSAIVRGLMRVGLTDEAWNVLDDELTVPLSPYKYDDKDDNDILKHRAHTLASIASRYFHDGQPHEAAKALERIRELGSVTATTTTKDPYLTMSEWCLPWGRLVSAASACNKKLVSDDRNSDSLPENLEELVWNAMWKVSGTPSQ